MKIGCQYFCSNAQHDSRMHRIEPRSLSLLSFLQFCTERSIESEEQASQRIRKRQKTKKTYGYEEAKNMADAKETKQIVDSKQTKGETTKKAASSQTQSQTNITYGCITMSERNSGRGKQQQQQKGARDCKTRNTRRKK
jgi:hypothetical protein